MHLALTVLPSSQEVCHAMSTGEIGLFVSISSRFVTSNVTDERTGIEYAEAFTTISGGRF